MSPDMGDPVMVMVRRRRKIRDEMGE